MSMLSGKGRFSVTASQSGDYSFTKTTNQQTVLASKARAHTVTAAANPGMSGFQTSVGGVQAQYSTGFLDGFVNTSNPQAMLKMYRDIYYHDPICGSAVDLMSTLPFSAFNLDGIQDPAILKTYLKCVENMHLKTLLPGLVVDYQVTGAFIGCLHFSEAKKIFDSLMTFKYEDTTITPLPFAYGLDPLIDVKLPPEFQKLLNSKDKRLDRVHKLVPDYFKNTSKTGVVNLSPGSTLYIPRRTFTTESLGTSWYRRVVGVHLLEKVLWRGTIDSAHKRLRGIMHLIVGSDDWEPTNDELTSLCNLFQQADLDPTSAIVATRDQIQVTEARLPQEFWKVGDSWDQLNAMKLKALGLTDNFISGEANYNVNDQGLSVFLAQLDTFRSHLTRQIFYDKLFPSIAVSNDFKKKEGQVIHGSMQNDSGLYWGNPRGSRIECDSSGNYTAVCDGSLEHQVYEIDDITKYIMPTIQWHKNLRPRGDNDTMERLGKLMELGVPVPLRMIAACADVSIDEILAQKDADLAIRKQTLEYMNIIKPPPPAGAEGAGPGGGPPPSGGSPEGPPPGVDMNMPQAGVYAPFGRTITPRGFGARLNDERFQEVAENMQLCTTDKSGKRRLTSQKGRRHLEEQYNKNLAERLERIQENRASLGEMSSTIFGHIRG